MEPQTAKDSGLFADEATFRALRQQERILWFRVQWSPYTGGLDMRDIYSPRATNYGDGVMTPAMNNAMTTGIAHTPTFGDATDYGMVERWTLNYGGTFTLIQRLDQEPPRW